MARTTRKTTQRTRDRKPMRIRTSQEPPTAPIVESAPQRPRTGLRVVARRPMGYCDVQFAQGEVFELQGARMDEVLVRLGYVEEFKGKQTYRCRETGKEFATEGAREQAGRLRERIARADERQRDRIEEHIQATAPPLYLDKTQAAQA